MSIDNIKTTMISNLLATKLMPPRCGRGNLPRPRLEQLIERVAESSLTVLKAPPGFGKSTLASAWAEGALTRGARVAWLTLDEADEDPQQLLVYVAAAIQRGFGGDDQSNLLKDLSLIPVRQLTTLLLNDLERRQEQCFLFLDDYHCVPEQTLVAAFDDLIRFAPDNLHLVFCGRSDLPINLFAHLYSDACLEVDAGDLRFDLEETRDLMLRTGLDQIEPGELRDLHDATEGWIAALRASLLNLRQRPAGSPRLPRNIAGLLDELINHLPAELALQLPCLAAVDKFSANLAEHLTGVEDGLGLVGELERLQLFVNALDDSAEWYSFHPLLREHLRLRLAPEQLQTVRRSAAHWFASRQNWMDAVRNALSAGDIESAQGWIAHCAMGMVERGDFMILLDWQRQLHDRLLQCPMELKIALAWAAALAMSSASARGLLNEVRAELVTCGRDNDSDSLYWECQALEAMILALEDHAQAGGRLGEACLPHLINRPWVYNTLLNVICYSHLCASRWQAFYSVAHNLKEPLEQRRFLFNQVYRLCLMGMGESLQGRFSQATAIYEEALRLANEQGYGHPVLRALPASFLAGLRYLQGRLDEAARLSFDNIEIAKVGGFLDCVASILVTANRLSYRNAGQQGVRHFMEEGERLAQARQWPRLQGQLLLERGRVSLQENRHTEAMACAQQLAELLERQLAHAPQEAGEYRCMASLAALWCCCATDHPAVDLEEAEALRKQAQRDNRRLMQTRLAIGLAIAHWHYQHQDQAVAYLLEATQLVEASGAHQLLADSPAQEVLKHIATCALQRKTLDNAQQARMQRLLPAQSDTEQVLSARPVITLTGKERHVLELVAQGKSNKEMAKLLGIAPETIKSHMKNIFGKLQVDSRAQAAVAAKAGGLI